MSKQPKRPYLLRAIYDWIVDSDMTPYVLVNADAPGVSVPAEHVKDGRIVLNVAPNAVAELAMDREALACNCRFAGAPFSVYLPMPSIEAIYARETGEGMAFDAVDPPSPDTPPDGLGSGPDGKPGGAGHLKVVK